MAYEPVPHERPVNRVDFSAPPNHIYKASVEREEYPSDRFVRLFKEMTVFIAAFALVTIVAWICRSALASPTANAEEQKWAMSTVTAMMGGVIGYLVKR